MANVFVYRLDDSQQCYPDHPSRSVDDDRKGLAKLIGDTEIIRGVKIRIPIVVSEVCGAPTGMGNVFEITEAGAFKLFRGFIGPMGFKLWTWDPPFSSDKTFSSTRPVPWPWKDIDAGSLQNALAALTQVGAQPTALAEIIGRRVRIINEGDAVTMDWIPSRVNIVINDRSEISSIYFG